MKRFSRLVANNSAFARSSSSLFKPTVFAVQHVSNKAEVPPYRKREETVFEKQEASNLPGDNLGYSTAAWDMDPSVKDPSTHKEGSTTKMRTPYEQNVGEANMDYAREAKFRKDETPKQDNVKDSITKGTKDLADNVRDYASEKFDKAKNNFYKAEGYTAAKAEDWAKDTKHKAEEWKDAASKKVGEAKEAAKDAKDKIEDWAKDAKDTVKEKSYEAKDTVQDTARKAKHKAEEWSDKAQDVKESVKDKAQYAAEKVADKVYDAKETVKEKAAEGFEAAKEKTEGAVEYMEEKAKQAAKGTFEYVKDTAKWTAGKVGEGMEYVGHAMKESFQEPPKQGNKDQKEAKQQ